MHSKSRTEKQAARVGALRAHLVAGLALALLVLSGLFTAAAPAQAQTTYVSNLDNAVAREGALGWIGNRYGWLFTTGNQAGGYPLSSVDIKFYSEQADSVLAVSIWSTSGGLPNAEIYSLTVPTLTTASTTTVSFSAPENATLSAGTTYAVVISDSKGSYPGSQLALTTATNTPVAEPGWSMTTGALRLSGSNWIVTWSPRTPLYALKGMASATGTDLMPQAWLARFGRTVAEQILDAAQERLRAPPAAGVQVTLARERIGGTGTSEEARKKVPKDPGSGSRAGNGAKEGHSHRQGYRPVEAHELLTGSSFQLTAAADGMGGGLASLWGRGARSSFDGREGEALAVRRGDERADRRRLVEREVDDRPDAVPCPRRGHVPGGLRPRIGGSRPRPPSRGGRRQGGEHRHRPLSLRAP